MTSDEITYLIPKIRYNTPSFILSYAIFDQPNMTLTYLYYPNPNNLYITKKNYFLFIFYILYFEEN